MWRMECTAFGDPDLLHLVEDSTPEPAPGEVLVEIEATGISFVDGLLIRGGYQVVPPLPFTPGNCCVGVIVAAGAEIDMALIGLRVATVLEGVGGAYASHVVAPVSAVAIVPASIGPDLAAASMESYLTITFATTHRVSIGAGDNVVVLGAGGGIGLAAVDIAHSLGAKVIAVGSTEAKRAMALRAGAHATIGYDDLKDRIRHETAGGADVVIDPVGGEAAESALRALGPGGRYCVVGFASGTIPTFLANVILLRNRSIVGIDWGDWSREVGRGAGNARMLKDVFARIEKGDLNPPTPSVVPLTSAGQILTQIAQRRAVGRYVLKPMA